ncbi:hypothetical protein HU200_001002 [Digitaria exilis]|uniref:Uncharacterized protein n=1 Tax=Digitaria exilis TaxID=1010633 RepID=A0A835KY30_9POAL|nr:hypothetical protein HU200_001002 [Digitaria exilis]
MVASDALSLTAASSTSATATAAAASTSATATTAAMPAAAPSGTVLEDDLAVPLLGAAAAGFFAVAAGAGFFLGRSSLTRELCPQMKTANETTQTETTTKQRPKNHDDPKAADAAEPAAPESSPPLQRPLSSPQLHPAFATRFETGLPAADVWEVYGGLLVGDLIPQLLPEIFSKPVVATSVSHSASYAETADALDKRRVRPVEPLKGKLEIESPTSSADVFGSVIMGE